MKVIVCNILHKENEIRFVSLVLLLQGWGLFGKIESARKLVLLIHSRLEISNCILVLYGTIFCSHPRNILEIFIVYKDLKTFHSVLRYLQY